MELSLPSRMHSAFDGRRFLNADVILLELYSCQTAAEVKNRYTRGACFQ